MCEITMEYLLNHKFEASGLEETFEIVKTSGMFSKAELGRLPLTDTERFDELNIRLNEMIFEIFENTSRFSQKSNLNYETVRKNIRIGSGKTLSKEMLSKFVVAAQLTVEAANELFELHSHRLDPERLMLDAVVVHCLENHHDIDGFFDTCEQVGLKITYKV
ncbi:MAG: hypothetical protein IKU29_08970 [Parabacteroides sp.]|nr:hypothetical protein [Parabacteroides sp.]